MRPRITIFCVAADDPRQFTLQAVDALRSASAVVVDAAVASVTAAHIPAHVQVAVVDDAATFARRAKAVRELLAQHGEVVRVVAGDPSCDGLPQDEIHALEPLARIDALPAVAAPAVDAARAWREQLPLHGWKVLVPRTKDPLHAVLEGLARDGAVSTVVTTLSVEPPRTPQQMERAVAGLVEGRYGWVVFTCANAVTAVWQKCREYGLDARVFAGTRIAAVGDDTVQALAEKGMTPDLMPAAEHTTMALLEVFPETGDDLDLVHRVLIPRADIATETLATGLTDLGWEVDEVTAFRTVRSAPPQASIRDAIKSGGFDAVVFTSSATVRNLIGLAGKPHANTLVACIGPSTARTAEEHGLRVDVMAQEPTHASVVQGLVDLAEGRRLAGAARAAAVGSARRNTK